MSTLKENVHDLFDGWNTIPNWLSFIRIALIRCSLCCLFRDINWWR